jgi:lipopolysaccharide export LptBFGC system permease protein LptF
MKNMDNTPERQAIIDQMVDLVRRDAPWVWGVHPKQFMLQHDWVFNVKPGQMANNTLKYIRLDPQRRAAQRAAWNRPVVWPLAVLLLVFVAAAIPAIVAYRRREGQTRR